MKNLLLFATSILILVVLNSCSTQMYVSNTVNAPLLKEKGEVHVNVTKNDLQAAVGITRNIGVMANGFYEDYAAENNYRHGGFMGEAGLGYFTSISKRGIFEMFGGLGAGRIYKQMDFRDANDMIYTGKFDAKATKFFLQPDIGFRSKFADLIFSTRFSFVKYTNFTSSNYPADELKRDYLDGDNLTGPLFAFAEPALTLRGGYKYIKLQTQWGLTLNMTGAKIKHPANFSSIGIVFTIAKWEEYVAD